jgi:cystathionine beta-lyase
MTATDAPATRLAHIARDSGRYDGLVNLPVQRGSSVLFPNAAALKAAGAHWDSAPYYGRHGTTPTFAFENALAELHDGYRAVVTCSGVSAITVALTAFLESGDHLLMTDAVYGPTRSFCDGMLRKFGVETTYYPPGQPAAALEPLIRPNTKVIYLESPGSLTFELEDQRGIAALARARGIKTLADNTWATPLFCKPLSLGIDGVIESITKYIGGHSDLLMGVVVGTKDTYPLFKKSAALLGQYAAPDDMYMALRGLRTLSLRLERQGKTALKLAEWLAQQPAIARVLHPGLSTHPQNAWFNRDFSGASGLFSIEVQSGLNSAKFVDALRLFGIGYSWGGFESLALPVALQGQRTRSALPAGDIVRFSIGLEDAGDLQADIAQALGKL